MGTVIKAEHISYSYPGDEETQSVLALKDVSFEIEEGSFVAILGHNGCGKSTLAKLLCMILSPDEGKLYINGKDMTDEDVSDEDIYDARRRVGMVFQNPDNQIVATIVEEDVAFGCENLGIPSEKIRKRVDEALETVGMTKYARHATHRLSGGQKQRIAIAGVLAVKPKIMILDESTAMLDPKGRREVMDVIKRLNKEEKITVILITHFMEEALEADRVIVMNRGEVVMQGAPEEIFSRSEELEIYNLTLPRAAAITKRLQEGGLPIKTCFTAESIAEGICESLRKI